MLVRVHEKDWKDVRSAVTPAFTSGKIKKVKYYTSYVIVVG